LKGIAGKAALLTTGIGLISMVPDIASKDWRAGLIVAGCGFGLIVAFAYFLEKQIVEKVAGRIAKCTK
jgi:hypothetical protein